MTTTGAIADKGRFRLQKFNVNKVNVNKAEDLLSLIHI